MVSCPSEQPPIALGVWSLGRPSAIQANTPPTLLGVFMAWAKRGSGFIRREGSLDVVSPPARPALELADDHVGGSSSFP
jgi:hypothetical protein